MSDPSNDPPADDLARREFRLKPREFTVANLPASTVSPRGPTDVREHFSIANAKLPPTSARPAPRNDVHAILHDNLTRASAAALNELKPAAPRRSRRLRDYLIVTIGGNLVMAVPAWFFRENGIVLLILGAGSILFNIRRTWTMWFVMDDY